MRNRSAVAAALFTVLCLSAPSIHAQDSGAPHLEKRGEATQLVVDGKPFLMLAAELHNSSSSSLNYMDPIWPKLVALPLNTVLTPLSWELVEPKEGMYDFSLIDGLLAQARENHLRIVFLWLASWKNGMSSYPPAWVKSDTRRFPRAILHGSESNILSTFGQATQEADARAFAAVMKHIREVDGRDHTVLMMQVENEVGVLSDARDHSPAAERAFHGEVPAELMKYLSAHRDSLFPDLRELWERNGAKTSGTWEQVFGAMSRTDEIFMAWHYSKYVQAVAAAGKAAYPIPMYVNTWLAGEDTPPGDFPSGGPQPRVVDVWKAAGSAIDIYSPDIYKTNFSQWCDWYNRAGNPLFIPETNGGAVGAANAFYAIGERAALGVSPFGIDSQLDFTAEKPNDLGASYEVLGELAPVILEAQTKGPTHGFVLDRNHPMVEFEMNGYTVRVSLDEIFGSHTEAGFGMIMATGPNEFMGAGKGFRVSFALRESAEQHVGLASVDEGRFNDGTWVAGRRLNGDENDQGEYWRFDQRRIHIEKAVVYRFP
jgi:beta-galactosidase GanA